MVRIKDLIPLLSEIFHLPGTSNLVIRTLSIYRKALSVKEIASRVRRSERSVRTSLSELVDKGLLQRRIKVTANKRLSYTYFLGHLDRLVKVARREVLNQLERLERLESTI
jgi:predicted transcriptional regulator